MTYKGTGQYDQEYAQCSCFWGTKPSKYVSLSLKFITKGMVLDLGAGEGKNAIYLAELGFDVVAVECSSFAIRNFVRRLNNLAPEIKRRIEIVQANVLSYSIPVTFDTIIAYGLLHCLPDMEALGDVIKRMKSSTRAQGCNVIATFTDNLPVPSCHDYLNPTLISEGYLETMYRDWEILAVENDILEEVHPTTKVRHRHSICRLLSRRLTCDR